MQSLHQLVIYVLCFIVVSFADDTDLVVSTQYGDIQGGSTLNTRYFTSIPYASPPVGSLRFMDPIEPTSWEDTLETTSTPPGCIQSCRGLYCPSTTSEDCLYLNVFTPLTADSSSALSVNVFIHGGAWKFGYSAPDTVFNATTFVSNTNSIVVTLNYRLGVLGLFYHPDYPEQFGGNYGLNDIILALKWVKNNIENFGGNPNKITLFGNSVGSGTVGILSVISEDNDDLEDVFQAAVISSNPLLGAPLRTIDTWGRMPNLIVSYTNCDDSDDILQCMRDSDAADLLIAMNTAAAEVKYDDDQLLFSAVQWTPTIGTGLIDEQPLKSFVSGNFNKDLSYLIGTSTFETLGITFGTFGALQKDFASFVIYLEKLLGEESADQILNFYGLPGDFGDVRYPPYAAVISTYGRYVCPARTVALAIADNVDEANQIYYFRYNHINSYASSVFPGSWMPYCGEDGVCHNAEITMIFDAPTTSYTLTDDEKDLSNALQNYINNLVQSVDDDDYLLWSAFESKKENTMIFTDGNSIEIVLGFDVEGCKLWDELNYSWLPSLSSSESSELSESSDSSENP